MLHLNIGICDDDKLYIKEITKLLDCYMIQYDIDISYDTYTSPLELLDWISATPGCYDILFLDVEMAEMNGLELSEKIRSIHRNIYTVFISNYPKYMQDSFRVHPFYYLVKPLSAETFTNIMNDILSAIQSEHKLVTLLQTDRSEETVDLGDILCIEVADGKKNCWIFTFLTTSFMGKEKYPPGRKNWNHMIFSHATESIWSTSHIFIILKKIM